VKKVLIIANLFYASPRIPGLAKYLPEFGWEPIILTVPLGENPDSRFGPPDDFRKKNRVIETYDYTSGKNVRLAGRESLGRVKPLLRFFYRRYKEIAHYPDKEKGWIPFAVNACEELLKKEEVDAMISSYSPATCHLIARKLRGKHAFPWVADFRDLWTQNHNYSYSPMRKIFEKRLELKTLSIADALVTTSTFWAEKLKAMHGKETYMITNGFDPEVMERGTVDLTKTFTITYTGQIYSGRQDPSILLAALDVLISDGSIDPKEVEVRFYGPKNELLQREAQRHGLLDVVKQYGIVPRETSFQKQRESQVLLLLNWDDPVEKGVYTGKVFEYLAAQRPILVTGGFGSDVVKELLDETDSGIYCSTVEATENAVKNLYSEYKLKGKVMYKGVIEKINKYSYREMAGNFATILDKLAERK
jgi:glycosyltransferase involved in cell wall biosynthesis